MKLKHKIKINIADRNGYKQEVLQSEHRSIPKKLLTFLFGEFCEVLVLTPGESVQGIEIKEPQYNPSNCRVRSVNFVITELNKWAS